MNMNRSGAGLVMRIAAPVVMAVIAIALFIPAVIGIANGIKATVQNVNVILSTGKTAN